MAIDSMKSYYPKLALPVYTKITDPKMNEYEIGEKYDIRIRDSERQEEKGGEGVYNYIHEALLVAKRETTFGELEDILIAFDAHTPSRETAIQRMFPSPEDVDDDKEVILAVFLRLDMVKEFVEDGPDAIHKTFSKEATEGNGRPTGIE